MAKNEPNQAQLETPKYKLTERAYLQGDILGEPGYVFEFEGVPAHYMEPVNDAAREMVRKHQPRKHDPVLELTSIAAGSETVAPQAERT